jgi:predicted GTPase
MLRLLNHRGIISSAARPCVLAGSTHRYLSLSTDPPDNRPLLRVVLVGRPNTGKSTLYNRLTGTKMAIVSAVPGTTRDRREGSGFLAGLPLKVVDTGGLDDRGEVSKHIQYQVARAVQEADIVLLMLDSKTGVTGVCGRMYGDVYGGVCVALCVRLCLVWQH